MLQVTEKEFFQALRKDSRDIMPRIINRFDHQGIGYRSEWRNQKSVSEELFGVTESGNFPFTKPTYFLVK